MPLADPEGVHSALVAAPPTGPRQNPERWQQQAVNGCLVDVDARGAEITEASATEV
jgi:hypothetical protein